MCQGLEYQHDNFKGTVKPAGSSNGMITARLPMVTGYGFGSAHPDILECSPLFLLIFPYSKVLPKFSLILFLLL